jgi:hypothetical protein
MVDGSGYGLVPSGADLSLDGLPSRTYVEDSTFTLNVGAGFNLASVTGVSFVYGTGKRGRNEASRHALRPPNRRSRTRFAPVARHEPAGFWGSVTASATGLRIGAGSPGQETGVYPILFRRKPGDGTRSGSASVGFFYTSMTPRGPQRFSKPF